MDILLLNLLALKYGLGSRIKTSSNSIKSSIKPQGVTITVAGENQVIYSPLALRFLSAIFMSCCFLIVPVEFIIEVNHISGVNNVFQAGQLLALVASIGVCWSIMMGWLTDKRVKDIEEVSDMPSRCGCGAGADNTLKLDEGAQGDKVVASGVENLGGMREVNMHTNADEEIACMC